jgi:ABC-2 type transport system ATP-binding protein
MVSGESHSASNDPGEVVLRCRALVKRYEDVVAVDGVDLSVRRGTCVGLLGPNGAGKTTTVEILEGLIRPDGGQVQVLGRSWTGGADRRLRERLGVQLQETKLSDKMTVLEVVRLFRSFYRRGRDPQEVIGLLGLQEKARARLGKLSGGQRQRVALACALVNHPEVLFLDEPTTGLDPQARLRIWEVVERYLAGGGTVLLTTHYMEEAAHLCDRVVIIDRGKVVAEGSPAQLIASLGGEQIIRFSVFGELPLSAVEGLAGVTSARERNGELVLAVARVGRTLPALLAELERRELRLAALTTHQATLEDVFVALTGRELRDGQ